MFGEGTWRVSVCEIKHFVEVGYGINPWLRIYLDESTVCPYVRLKKGSISLSRNSHDYAKTILECLDPNVSGIERVWDSSASLQTLTSLEDHMNRTFSPILFKTIFKTLTENGLEKQRFKLSHNMFGIVLYNNKTEEPYLSIRKHETDKEILGRLLCGKYLFHSKDGAEPWNYDRA